MKKIWCLFFFTIISFCVLGACSKDSPTGPGADNTATVQPADTGTATQTATGTLQATLTATEDDTATVTPTLTAASTSTATPTGTATQTATEADTATVTPTATTTATSTDTATATATFTSTEVHPYMLQYGSTGSADTQFEYVTGMCSDENDNMYFADADNSRIKIYNSAGTFQSAWGVSGSGDGQLSYPYSICYDGSEYLYVADTGNYRVQKFTKTGVYQEQFGSITEWAANPRNIKYAGGYLYILFSNKLIRCAPDGSSQETIGTEGTGVGQLNNCHGLYVDSSGNIYMGVVGRSKIVKFDNGGNFVTEWSHLWAAGITMDIADNLVVTAASSSIVSIYTAAGVHINDFGNYDYAGTGLGLFLEPYAVGSDSQGNIYISDTTTDIVQKFGK